MAVNYALSNLFCPNFTYSSMTLVSILILEALGAVPLTKLFRIMLLLEMSLRSLFSKSQRHFKDRSLSRFPYYVKLYINAVS